MTTDDYIATEIAIKRRREMKEDAYKEVLAGSEDQDSAITEGSVDSNYPRSVSSDTYDERRERRRRRRRERMYDEEDRRRRERMYDEEDRRRRRRRKWRTRKMARKELDEVRRSILEDDTAEEEMKEGECTPSDMEGFLRRLEDLDAAFDANNKLFMKDEVLRWATYTGGSRMVKELIRAYANIMMELKEMKRKLSHSCDPHEVKVLTKHMMECAEATKELSEALDNAEGLTRFQKLKASVYGLVEKVKRFVKASINFVSRNYITVALTTIVVYVCYTELSNPESRIRKKANVLLGWEDSTWFTDQKMKGADSVESLLSQLVPLLFKPFCDTIYKNLLSQTTLAMILGMILLCSFLPSLAELLDFEPPSTNLKELTEKLEKDKEHRENLHKELVKLDRKLADEIRGLQGWENMSTMNRISTVGLLAIKIPLALSLLLLYSIPIMTVIGISTYLTCGVVELAANATSTAAGFNETKVGTGAGAAAGAAAAATTSYLGYLGLGLAAMPGANIAFGAAAAAFSVWSSTTVGEMGQNLERNLRTGVGEDVQKLADGLIEMKKLFDENEKLIRIFTNPGVLALFASASYLCAKYYKLTFGREDSVKQAEEFLITMSESEDGVPTILKKLSLPQKLDRVKMYQKEMMEKMDAAKSRGAWRATDWAMQLEEMTR